MATKTAAKSKISRAIPARTIRLTLTIEGTVYEVLPFEDEDEGLSVAEWKHTLIEAGRRRFHVYPRQLYSRKEDGTTEAINGLDRWRCTRCGTHDCRHIKAILEVGLS